MTSIQGVRTQQFVSAAEGIAPADVSLLGLGDMFNNGSLFSGRSLDEQLKCWKMAIESSCRLPSWSSSLRCRHQVRCCSRCPILTGVGELTCVSSNSMAQRRHVTCPCGSWSFSVLMWVMWESPLLHLLGCDLRVRLQQKARHVLA